MYSVTGMLGLALCVSRSLIQSSWPSWAAIRMGVALSVVVLFTASSCPLKNKVTEHGQCIYSTANYLTDFSESYLYPYEDFLGLKTNTYIVNNFFLNKITIHHLKIPPKFAIMVFCEI